MYTDIQKQEFLISLTKKYYRSGDDYYAIKNKKDKWHFGYSNDYPLQHGSGENMMLPDKMIETLMDNIK